MEIMDFVWLGIAILAAVVEAIVPALVSVWFVPAGLVALVLSLFGAPLWAQILLFVVVSFVSLAFTRPLARKLLTFHREHTNADRVVGATGIVIQDIDNIVGTGRVVVMGNSWPARSSEVDGKIDAGVKVRIEQIVGVTLLVTPVPLGSEEKEEVNNAN